MTQKHIDKSLYYDPHLLESHNSLFNFIIGERGKGKTYYYAKKRVISNFINNKIDIGDGVKQGEQFIYLRRHKNELKTLGTFFDDVRHEFPDYKLTVKNNVFYCNDQVMGYAIMLSTANQRKSTAYPYVQTIVFDEFINEKGYTRYMPDEANVFLGFYETVARLRDNVKVFFLGNAVSLVNPYFVYFNIMPDTSKRFTSVQRSVLEHNKGRHLILIEILQEDINDDGISFRDIKARTDFGQIVAGTDYDKTANDNQFIHDTDDFIEKKDNDARFLYSMFYMGKMYGVWISNVHGKMYVSYKQDKNTKKVYALTTDDFKANMFLVDNLSKYNGLVVLKKAFTNGYLMFENAQIKSAMFDAMKLLGC